jgi:hypothetical protein
VETAPERCERRPRLWFPKPPAWRRVQFIRCKASRYTTQRHPSDKNRGRTGEGRGEGGSWEMEMPPLDSKGPPLEARTEAPPRTGKLQVERKLADEAQTRACRKLGYTCMLVCVCVCVESKHPRPRPAQHRERMFPRHTMRVAVRSHLFRGNGELVRKRKNKNTATQCKTT